MSISIEEKCDQLWSLLKAKAPALKPKIIVRGFDDDQLLALCSSDLQREALETSLDRFSSSSRGKHCSVCQEEITEAGGAFASEWDFDFDKKLQILSRLSFLCETCYAISDLEDFLPRLSKPNAHVLPHIAKFHTVNGLSAEEASPVALVDLMVQCFSIAFSLRIILTNFPQWTLVDNHRKPFNQHTDFSSLAKSCLAHIEKPTKQAESKKSKKSIEAKVAPSPSKTASPKPKMPKSNLFEIDKTPRKGESPKRKQDSGSADLKSPQAKRAKEKVH